MSMFEKMTDMYLLHPEKGDYVIGYYELDTLEMDQVREIFEYTKEAFPDNKVVFFPAPDLLIDSMDKEFFIRFSLGQIKEACTEEEYRQILQSELDALKEE